MHPRRLVERLRPRAGALERDERLGQHRSLAPGAARQDLEVAPAGAHDRLVARAERRQVGHRQEPAVVGVIGGDLARDVALVEGRARGLEPGGAIAAGAPLLVRHARQHRREVALHEPVADRRRVPAGEEDRRVLRPPGVAGPVRGDLARQVLVDREAVPRDADRRRRGVTERVRAVVAQRRDPGVRRGRHDRVVDARGHRPAEPLDEVVGRHRRRPVAEPGDRDDLARRLADQDRRDAGDVHLVGADDAEGDPRRDARVDRVASRLEHREPRRRRQVVTARDGMAAPVERGASGLGGIGTHPCQRSQGDRRVPESS